MTHTLINNAPHYYLYSEPSYQKCTGRVSE